DQVVQDHGRDGPRKGKLRVADRSKTVQVASVHDRGVETAGRTSLSDEARNEVRPCRQAELRDQIVAPPSQTIVAPVTKLAARDARYTAAPAISSGSPMRRSGTCLFTSSSRAGSSHRARAKSVRIRPGAMQFTRTPCGPYSCARLRTSCMSAAF